MDAEIDPCENFYEFACGNFIKNTVIPDDQPSIDTFSMIDDDLQLQLRTSIEEEIQPNESKPFKLAKALYKSCMNKSKCIRKSMANMYRRKKSVEVRLFCQYTSIKFISAYIEDQGLEPLFKILKKLGGWPVLLSNWDPNEFDWKESVYRNRVLGYSVDYFISFDIDADPKNSSRRMITVSS